MCDSKVRAVFILHRHGVRAPLMNLGIGTCPEGYENGDLTKWGLQQMQNLGNFILEQYKDFKQIIAWSSRAPRCKESAEAFFSDVVPKPDLQILNSSYIEMHRECVRKTNDTVRDLKMKFSFGEDSLGNFIDLVASDAAVDVGTVFRNVLLDTYYCYKANGWTELPWMTKHSSDILKAENILFKSGFQGTEALVLSEILEKIIKTSNQTFDLDTVGRMITFSVHDIILSAFMTCFKIDDRDRWPQFADAIVLELVKDSKPGFQIHHVQLKSQDSSSFDVIPGVQLDNAKKSNEPFVLPLSVMEQEFSSIHMLKS